MYKVIIPFKLRIFYSETKGEILQPPSEFQERFVGYLNFTGRINLFDIYKLYRHQKILDLF